MMTNTDPFALIEAHIAAITPAHRDAFAGPVARDYKPGDVVWLYDHYNTAVVRSHRAVIGGGWVVVTTDADGSTSTYDYPADRLRPAVTSVEFRWPVDVTAQQAVR